MLRIMINDNEHHQPAQEGDQSATTPTTLGRASSHNAGTAQDTQSKPPHIEENVRATLSPLPGPHVGRSSMSADSRSSVDMHRSLDVRRSMDGRSPRRRSHDAGRGFSGYRSDRQSMSPTGDRSPMSPKLHDTLDSATESFDPGTESSAHVQSMDESNASASQILDRSDVFRAPTLQPGKSPVSARSDRLSQDTTRSSGASALHSKSRQSTKQASSAGPTHLHQTSRHQQPEADNDPDSSARLSGSSTALQDIAAYPLQKATGIAGFLRTRSKKMGNLLATESMGYYEKVSGMLAGGRKHYTMAEGLQPHDQVHGLEEDEDAAKAAQHFQEHFALPDEQLQSSYFAYLQRILPNYGKIYISGRSFCFRSLVPTVKTKVC